MNYKCPKCDTELTWDSKNPNRPFCSDTCKNADFIAWANEENALPGSPDYDEMFSKDLEDANHH